MTLETMEADSIASWLSAHCLRLNLQLHTIDLANRWYEVGDLDGGIWSGLVV